ncbi:MAG TPA: hypothetical protein ENN80_10150 [Candidatus Hydrogenedentes bacterium]|nr:hypothetical protein [Candidatus Hydrogenedentota bacterium]
MNEARYLGDELRVQREAMGLSTEEVCTELCIPKAYIEALECGCFDAMPPACYAVAFLKSYCAFLGLSPERYADSYRARAQVVRPSTPTHDKALPAAFTRWRDDLLTWAAICAIFLLGWLAYTVVVQPEAPSPDNRVEAGARIPGESPAPLDMDF